MYKNIAYEWQLHIMRNTYVLHIDFDEINVSFFHINVYFST